MESQSRQLTYSENQGIYLIVNQVNGKMYVGLSKNVRQRFHSHKAPSKIAKGKSALTQAFRKYGIENFIFELIECVPSVDLLPEREVYWIGKLRPAYNMNQGGLGNCGFDLSDDVRCQLRAKGKEQWAALSEQEKARRAANNLTGPSAKYSTSAETKEKLRLANIGKTRSAESRQKASVSLKVAALGNKNGNKRINSYKDGVKVKEYLSAVLAAADAKIHPSNITKVLKGKQKSAGGFQWKYAA